MSPRPPPPRPDTSGGGTVYVGMLRYDTEEKTIRKWFENYGRVASVKVRWELGGGGARGAGEQAKRRTQAPDRHHRHHHRRCPAILAPPTLLASAP